MQTWNMKWVEHWNVAMMGYVTGDRHFIDYGLNDPGGGTTSGKGYCRYDPKKYGGFHQIIERNITDGTWHEPPEYLFNAISYPFFTIVLAAKHYDGTDLYHLAGAQRQLALGTVSAVGRPDVSGRGDRRAGRQRSASPTTATAAPRPGAICS